MHSKAKKCFFIFFALICNLNRCFGQSDTNTSPPQSSILWSLSPCQSAFWVPNIPTSFNQDWITYQYEGNPLSKFGECVFTLESDPNTRIEIVITEVHLFGKEIAYPPPCLELYDVKTDGSIKLLKQECSIILSFNAFEMFPTYTETNVAVITTTIRYGSFQLRARAVPKNFGYPKVTSTTNRLSIDSVPTITPAPNVNNIPDQPAQSGLPTVVTVLPQSNITPSNMTESNNAFQNLKPFHNLIGG